MIKGGKRLNSDSGAAVMEAVIIIVVLIVVGLVAYIVFSKTSNNKTAATSSSTSTSSTPASSTSGSSPYAVLSPATVPSKTAECKQQVVFSASGTSGPIQCSNGDLNASEWSSLSALEPTVMTLGYNATVSQVESALCNDVHENVSNPIELINYQISALYYGWNFSTSPSVVITNGSCVNTDD